MVSRRTKKEYIEGQRKIKKEVLKEKDGYWKRRTDLKVLINLDRRKRRHNLCTLLRLFKSADFCINMHILQKNLQKREVHNLLQIFCWNLQFLQKSPKMRKCTERCARVPTSFFSWGVALSLSATSERCVPFCNFCRNLRP
jgi:3-deoxy-D-arabino-heptulosonate 7-phosphate (DAHP) synthase class II